MRRFATALVTFAAVCWASLALAQQLPMGIATFCIDLSIPAPYWKPCGQLAAAGAGQRVELIPTQIFSDDFGTGTLDTTNRWNTPTAAGGGVTATNAVGATVLSSGTTAAGYSYLQSQTTFAGRSPGFLLFHSTVNLQSPEIVGNYKAFGFATIPATPTTTLPLTNAVVYEVTPTGKLQAATYASGGRTLIADLSVVVPGTVFPDARLTPQPTDGKAHLYQIWFRGDYTEYDIDGVQVATFKSGAFGPDVNTLPISYLTINGTGGAASTIQVNQATVGDEARNGVRLCDATFSWRCVAVTAPGGLGIDAYPGGATKITAIATGSTGAVTATLAGVAAKTTYICGFDISAAGGTATISPITITGLLNGTFTFQGISAGGLPFTRTYTPCVPASAVNTGIAVVTTADGSASAVDVQAWGFQQ